MIYYRIISEQAVIREHWQLYRPNAHMFSVLGKTQCKGKKNLIWQVVDAICRSHTTY